MHTVLVLMMIVGGGAWGVMRRNRKRQTGNQQVRAQLPGGPRWERLPKTPMWRRRRG